MQLLRPIEILSPSEKKIHSAIWIAGTVLINIPNWEVTMGPFHSEDFSLIIPSIYGVLLNASLFYRCATAFQKATKTSLSSLLKLPGLLFLKLSLLEASLDCLYFSIHYGSTDLAIIIEIVWGQLLLNFIFFYLPSVVFGIIKGWQKGENRSEEPISITIKDGTETVHLPIEKITHIESDKNYVVYHAEKKHTIRQSLSQTQENLPAFFLRVHKSFIVNIRLIEKQTANELVVGGSIIPIGRKYKNELKAFLEK